MSDTTPTETTKPSKKKSGSTAPKPRRFTKELEVELTDAEMLKKNEALLTAMEQRDALKLDKSSSTATFNSRIKLAEDSVKELRLSLRSKKERREVEVIERFHFDTNTVEEIRTDTSEVVYSRAMRLDERQATLPLIDESKAKDDAPATAPAVSPGNGKKAARAPSPDGICASTFEEMRCLRTDGHSGRHSYSDGDPAVIAAGAKKAAAKKAPKN